MSTAVLLRLVSGESLRSLAAHPGVLEIDRVDEDLEARGGRLLPVPAWVTAAHLLFMAWTVMNGALPGALPGRLPVLPRVCQGDRRVPEPAGTQGAAAGRLLPRRALVIHGGLQGWWIAPVLASLSERPLFLGAALLTAFNDNALITYLATLVPDLDQPLKLALVQGAVTGGGLTVIANAPNPAGQALLGRCFTPAIQPLLLLARRAGSHADCRRAFPGVSATTV